MKQRSQAQQEVRFETTFVVDFTNVSKGQLQICRLRTCQSEAAEGLPDLEAAAASGVGVADHEAGDGEGERGGPGEPKVDDPRQQEPPEIMRTDMIPCPQTFNVLLLICVAREVRSPSEFSVSDDDEKCEQCQRAATR